MTILSVGSTAEADVNTIELEFHPCDELNSIISFGTVTYLTFVTVLLR